METPFKLAAEFTFEQAYISRWREVRRGNRSVNDLDEYYSNLLFVLTPRIPVGILRLGAQWERYSFGFSDGGEQSPNTLLAVNGIIGLRHQVFGLNSRADRSGTWILRNRFRPS